MFFLNEAFCVNVGRNLWYRRNSVAMTQSVLTLIYKKGEKQLLKNYRPISLMNYDCKIISKSYQSGYMKRRLSSRKIQDIFEYTEWHPRVITRFRFWKGFWLIWVELYDKRP